MTTAPRTPLFENAVDSLERGVALFLVREESPTAIKHAILTIFHSIELLLKERLAAVHPILIYKNIDKPIRDDSPTVGLAEALARLSNAGIGLSVAECQTLVELQSRRNRIEHHRFDPAADHAVVVGQALKFILEFLPGHLDTTLEDVLVEEDAYKAVIDAVLNYKEQTAQAVKEALASGCTVVYCRQCGEHTLALYGPRGHYCFLCREEFLLEQCERCAQMVPPEEVEACGMCFECQERVYANE